MVTAVVQDEDVRYVIGGVDAASIVRSVEHGVVSAALMPGQAVPSVRQLARRLGLSPTTVAAAYRDLRQRGVLVTHDRSRTVVAHGPPLAVRPAPATAGGLIDLASGNPDPALLPDLREPLAAVNPTHRLYGDTTGVPALLELARQDLHADGVPVDHLAVVAGALDGIERVIGAHARVGDRIAVEDPGYVGAFDLVRALGLVPVPVAVDDAGMRPERLADALEGGASVVLATPRAHNPTGAALTPPRARELRAVLAVHPDVLVVEDDHASWISGAAHHRLAGDRARWALVRSVAKSLGPDLRVAVLAGDEVTVTRVLGRQGLGTGWVSGLLQDLVVHVWTAARAARVLDTAAAAYAARRRALLTALADRDVEGHGGSGLNVWVPVAEEVPIVQHLAAYGWAVQAGEPYRIGAPPAIRITVARLPEERADELADHLVAALATRMTTRRG